MAHKGNPDIRTNHNSFTVRWCWLNKDIERILKELDGNTNFLHICSGTSGIGAVRMDRYLIDGKNLHKTGIRGNNAGSPNVLGDMFHLPFKSSSIKNIIIDPPYDPQWVEHHVYRLMLDELLRVLQPAGRVIIISQLIFSHKLLTLKYADLWETGKNNYYYKIMASYNKHDSQLSDYT